jgi:hypothetical protein
MKNKIKSHLADHKTAYISGGLVVASAISAFAIGRVTGAKQIVVTDVANVKLWSPTTTNVTVILEELSTPSKPVWCPELKQAFNSMHEAARAVGTSAGNVSKVVSGKSPHIKGFTFEEIKPTE